jgi:hypothetical protein
MYGTKNTIPGPPEPEDDLWRAVARGLSGSSAPSRSSSTVGGGLWDAAARSASSSLIPMPAPSSSGENGLWAALARTSIATPTSSFSGLASLYAPPVSGLAPAPTIPLPQISIPAPLPVPGILQWAYVTRRFDQLIESMGMLQGRIDDGNTKQAGVRACLNRAYWGISSETANSFLIGSWGKTDRVRPSNDIDVMFILPNEVYFRFQQRSGNIQSQLLQELREVLSLTYSDTEMSGDRQVVVVKFGTIPVEVVPAFRCSDGSLIICDTKNDGRYKAADPVAELAALDASDTRWNGNTRALARMMKKWQQEREVKGLKAFQLERLAIEFLASWPFSHHDRFWYDWMVRDFFLFLLGRANKSISMPGTGEVISLGAEWLGEAVRAYKHAIAACVYEQANKEALAGQSWQEIFGSAAPVRVS